MGGEACTGPIFPVWSFLPTGWPSPPTPLFSLSHLLLSQGKSHQATVQQSWRGCYLSLSSRGVQVCLRL